MGKGDERVGYVRGGIRGGDGLGWGGEMGG